MIIGSVASGTSNGGGEPEFPTAPLPSFQIQNSLRLRETSYLQITNPAAPTSGKKFTFSVWVKNIYKVADYCTIYQHNPYNLGTPASRYGFSIWLYDGVLYVTAVTAGTTNLHKQLGYALKDNASWYHIVVSVDTDLPLADDRCTIYINGVRQTNFDSGSLINPGQGVTLSGPSGSNVTSHIGVSSFANPSSLARYMKGYLADFILVDGQALLPTVFGELNQGTNTWVPIDADITSVGNTGFRLKFNNTTSAANLCLSSVGTNHFGPTNISVAAGTTYDAMKDAPSGALTNNCGNYCVLDGNILPVDNSPTLSVATLTEGNLKVYGSQATSPATGQYSAIGTQGVSTSKVYFEVTAGDISLTPTNSFIGFCKATNVSDGSNDLAIEGSQGTFGVSPLINAGWRAHTNNTYGGITGTSNLANGDIIGIAFDPTAGKLWVSKNGVFAGSQNPSAGTGEVITGLPITTWLPAITSVNQNVNGSVSLTANFGQIPFQYTPPTGFGRINTDTLSSGTVLRSDRYFNTYLYKGNSTGQQVGEPQEYIDSYTISNSMRFIISNSTPTYLRKTFTNTPSNSKKWSLSVWIKGGSSDGFYGGVQRSIIGVILSSTISAGASENYIGYNSNNTLVLSDGTVGILSQVVADLSDYSKWNHLLLVYDSTEAVSENRVRWYINGKNYPTGNIVTLNADSYIGNSSRLHSIGTWASISNGHGYNGINAKLADFIFTDGIVLNPSDVLLTDTNGYARPKNYTGSYGTNGYRLQFAGPISVNADYGIDSSGQGNSWPTVNGITANTDTNNTFSYDTPTNSAASFIAEPSNLYVKSYNVGEDVSIYDASVEKLAYGSYVLKQGDPLASRKFVFQVKGSGAGSGNYGVGIATKNVSQTGTTWSASAGEVLIYKKDGNLTNGTTNYSLGTTFANTDTITVYVDFTSNRIGFDKNGVFVNWFYVSELSSKDWYPVVLLSTNITSNINFAQRAYAYALNFTGYIDVKEDSLSENVYDTSLKTGTVLLIADRSTDAKHKILTTSTLVNASIPQNLITSGQAALVSDATKVISINHNGFLLGNSPDINSYNNNYVAWAWNTGKANTSANNLGTVTSYCYSNPESGINAITATAPSSSSVFTIGHGLPTTPKFVLVKDSSNVTVWQIYHQEATNTNRLIFDFTSSAMYEIPTGQPPWGNSLPSSTVIGLGTNTPINTSAILNVLAFSEVAGFSSFSYYNGNGNINGPFVYLGFKPTFILIKRVALAGDWKIIDTKRNSSFTEEIAPGLTTVPVSTSRQITIMSNGFKVTSTSTNFNNLNDKYIFAAFAEAPFKYAQGA